MSQYDEFTVMTDESLVDATCTVKWEGNEKTFKHFAVVGFDPDDVDSELLSITACDARELYRAIKALEGVYTRAMSQVPVEAQRDIEADIMIQQSLFDCTEDEDDD